MIDKIFQNIHVFTFSSVLVIDLNMGYLSIPIIEPMRKLALQSKQTLVWNGHHFQAEHENWLTTTKLQCKWQTIANNKKENLTWIHHIYRAGGKVLIIQKNFECKKKAKLSSPTVCDDPHLQ